MSAPVQLSVTPQQRKLLKEMWTIFGLNEDDRLFDSVLQLLEADVTPTAILDTLRSIKDQRISGGLQQGIVPPWEKK